MSKSRPPSRQREFSASNKFSRPGVLSPEFLDITKASRRRFPADLGIAQRSVFDSHEDRTDSSRLQPDVFPGHKVPSEPAIRKFKRVVNVVRRQLMWFKIWAQDVEDCCKGLNGHGTPSLNVAAFRPASEQLSRKAKLILMKPAHVRNAQELRFLDRCVARLKCFEQYCISVRKQLSKVLYFEAFEKDRVIIRQGRKGHSFYFIVSGCVIVELEETDRRGRKQRYTVAELRSGASFGERALLGYDRRTATVLCKEYSEFLSMDNQDFDSIIRSAQERDSETRSNCLRGHPILRDLEPGYHKKAVDSSRILHFPSNCVIVKDLSQPTDMIYFVTKGCCKVVQRVELWKAMSEAPNCNFKPSRLILPPVAAHTDFRLASHEKVDKWWVLKTLHPGDYFGIGEGPANSCVISDNVNLECLLISTVALARHRKGMFLSEIKEQAKIGFPTLAEAFRSYLELRQWEDYKKGVVEDVIKGKLKRQCRNFMTTFPVVLRD